MVFMSVLETIVKFWFDLDKEDDLNFSLRVEQTLQLGFHGDEADAIPEFPVTESVTTESGEIIQEELVVNGEEIEEVEEEEEMEEEEEDEGKITFLVS